MCDVFARVVLPYVQTVKIEVKLFVDTFVLDIDGNPRRYDHLVVSLASVRTVFRLILKLNKVSATLRRVF